MDEEESINAEIAKFSEGSAEEETDKGPDIDAIRTTLETMVDVSGARPDEELLNLFVAKILVEAPDHFIWYLNFSGRDYMEIQDVVTGKKIKSSITLSTKKGNKNAIRLSGLKKITSLSEGEGGSDEDKKLKDQLAVSDKAFKIHLRRP